MKALRMVILFAMALATACSNLPSQTVSKKGKWICAPCGCKHDQHTFKEAGTCPSCGMPLVFEDDIVDVGIVLFDGVQIIDYTGPYEVFGHASYRVYTVSESGEPLTTAMGMRVEPSYSFKNSPQADVLVIPGGNLHDAVDNRRLISWVTTQAKAAKQVLSVCNGAFILAKTGLLDHKKATTFHRLLEKFEATAAKTEVVWDQRFVDNGKIITTAGLSSGIDGALHVVSKLDGHGTAAGVALHLEYDWRPDENYARAALADMYLPRIAAPDGSQIKVVKTEGSRSTWTKEYRLHGKDRD
ncbi:MAG: DJ-1/PfpI family protein, partial [Myxococcota bacterium]